MNQAPAETIRQLLASQVQCVLSTVAEDTPNQHLMAYAFEPSLGNIFVVSRRQTTKTHNMLGNPAVSLLWDNRTGNTTDHREGLALAAEGNTEVLQGWMRVRAVHLLRVRNPELATLLRHADAIVFSIKVDTYRLAEGYGNVTRWTPCTPALSSGQYDGSATHTLNTPADPLRIEAA